MKRRGKRELKFKKKEDRKTLKSSDFESEKRIGRHRDEKFEEKETENSFYQLRSAEIIPLEDRRKSGAITLGIFIPTLTFSIIHPH